MWKYLSNNVLLYYFLIYFLNSVAAKEPTHFNERISGNGEAQDSVGVGKYVTWK